MFFFFFFFFYKKLKVELETAKKFNVRSRDLLMSCALPQCVLKNNDEDMDFNIDWSETDCRLDAMRRNSLDYIKSIAARAERIEKE